MTWKELATPNIWECEENPHIWIEKRCGMYMLFDDWSTGAIVCDPSFNLVKLYAKVHNDNSK